MKSKKFDVRKVTQVALLAAVMLVLSFTPLGYIPLPFMKATTMHIPVIIGACLLGPKIGALLGGLFGITSVIQATISPNITSFVFTPFYSFSPEFQGSWYSLIVAIVPRILIGVVVGWAYIGLKKALKKETPSLVISGVLGSMTNTIGVMGLIYLLFGEQYAAATGNDPSLLLSAILAVVGINGITEAVIAGVLTAAICKALLVVFRRMGKRV